MPERRAPGRMSGPASQQVRQWVDSAAAPPVLALSIDYELAQAGDRHRHASGQLYCLRQGVMMAHTDAGLFANPPRFVGWIPPHVEHSIIGPGPVIGWTVFVRPDRIAGLPATPALLTCPRLLEPLVERLSESPSAHWPSPQYRRLAEVFLDELCAAEVRGLSLPLPEDRRLRAITRVLMENPADPRTGPELAHWAGLSPRSLSRHWSAAVGMSIAKYRQVARLLKSLDGLAKGRGVQQVAWDVGFETASAYILAFKATFGVTPGKYFGG